MHNIKKGVGGRGGSTLAVCSVVYEKFGQPDLDKMAATGAAPLPGCPDFEPQGRRFTNFSYYYLPLCSLVHGSGL